MIENVEIFYNYDRVASHKRCYKPGMYTTLTDHMPSTHQAYEKTISRRYNCQGLKRTMRYSASEDIEAIGIRSRALAFWRSNSFIDLNEKFNLKLFEYFSLKQEMLYSEILHFLSETVGIG